MNYLKVILGIIQAIWDWFFTSKTPKEIIEHVLSEEHDKQADQVIDRTWKPENAIEIPDPVSDESIPEEPIVSEVPPIVTIEELTLPEPPPEFFSFSSPVSSGLIGASYTQVTRMNQSVRIGSSWIG